MKVCDMKVLHAPKLCLIAWKDKEAVSMLTTHECPVMMTTDKLNRHTGEYKQNPNVIISYNNNVDGVDLSDQVLHPYGVLRKIVKLYHKMFFHLLDMAIFNSCVVHNSFRPQKGCKRISAILDEL